MATETNEIILEINVRYEDALNGIEQYRAEIERTKKDQQTFNAELEKGEITQKEYRKLMEESNATIRQRQSDIRTLQKELQNNVKQENALAGSYNQLSAQMSILKNRYKELSAEQRNGAEGDALRKQIVDLNDALKEADANIGNFTRNVGNYENAIVSAASGGNSFAQTLLNMATDGENASASLATLTANVKGFSKQLLALLANPIVATIAAIVGVANLLAQAFKRNEDNGQKLNVALAKVSSMFQLLLKVLEPVSTFIVDVLIKSLEGLGKAFTWINDKIAQFAKTLGFDKISENIEKSNEGIKLMAKQAEELAKAENELAKAERNAEKVRLEYQKQAEDLRQQRDDESLSIDERVKANEQLGKVLKDQANEELRIANLAVTAAQQRIKVYGETSDNLDKLAEAQTRVADIQERINSQESEQLMNLNSLRKEAADQQAAQREQELAALQQAQDTAIALMKDGAAKQRAQVNAEYDRQIAELRTKLDTEKNLTEQAREQLNTAIANLEQQRANELKKISDEEIDNAIQREQTRIQNLLAAVKQGSEEETALRLQQLENQRKAELTANARLTEEMRQSEAEINAKYDAQEAQIKQDAIRATADKQAEQLRLEWENRLLQVQEGTQAEMDLKLQQAQAEHEALLALDAEEKEALYASEEAYKNAVLQSEREIQGIKQQNNELALQQLNDTLTAAQAIGDGLTSVLEAFAGDNEEMAAFSKAIALFNVGLATAQAIANGVASAAAAGPPPANLIAIGSTIATVLANIAQAKQILSQEQQPKSPKFAAGGLVRGAGSGTSDSIAARLSSGESVMTALATSMFAPVLSGLNQIGGGVPIQAANASAQVLGEDMLANAFARGMASMPSPVVSVEEISRVSSRVRVIETMGNA